MNNHILDKLPEHCYSINRTSTEPLIIIKRGETGYYPSNGGPMPVETAEQMCAMYNEKLGVSKAQAAAMECGSMFGWDCPGADPDRYDESGVPKAQDAAAPEAEQTPGDHGADATPASSAPSITSQEREAYQLDLNQRKWTSICKRYCELIGAEFVFANVENGDFGYQLPDGTLCHISAEELERRLKTM